MKIEITRFHLEVKMNQPSAAQACTLAAHVAEFPPIGYKWIDCRIKRRAHSGKNVNLELHFVHNDRYVPALTREEAKQYFHMVDMVNDEFTQASLRDT